MKIDTKMKIFMLSATGILAVVLWAVFSSQETIHNLTEEKTPSGAEPTKQVISPDEQKLTPLSTSVPTLQIGQIDENTSYTSKVENGTKIYGIVYKNFLERNDAVMLLNVFNAINFLYGEHQVANLEPRLVSTEGGTNLLAFDSIDGQTFYVLLVKDEETGKIMGLDLWRK